MRIYSSLYYQSLPLFRCNGSKLSASSFQRLATFSTKNQNESVDVQPKDSGDASSYIHPSLKKKLPKREPFVKNLFIGIYDKVFLEYPEVLDKERNEMFDRILKPFEQFFKNEVSSSKIKEASGIPPEIIQGMKDLGMYGMEVPFENGGLGLSETEMSRLYEVIGLDSSVNLTIGAHQMLGLKAILKYGTEAQKGKYLARLASGEWTAAFALTDATGGSDAASIECQVELSNDQKSYVLNGKKLWVSNGGVADIFIIFAKKVSYDELHGQVSAFIVERNFGGVTSGDSIEMLGLNGADITEVQFDNTSIPAENLLHNENEGLKVAIDVMGSTGCSVGSSCVGLLKNLMNLTVAHAVKRKQFGKPLTEFGLISNKFSKMAIDIYAMEAMVYLTSGLNDLLDGQDTAVESAIVKAFSSEKTCEHVSECLQIMGSRGLLTENIHEQIYKDTRSLPIMHGTTELMKLFISLSSLQHAGISLADHVQRLRNPFLYPAYVLKEKWHQMTGKIPLNFHLIEKLHPSLSVPAENLEISVKKLERAVVYLLQRKGRDVSTPQAQPDLERLADVAIDLYAMTAVIARASRSYCIGLHNCDHEMQMCGYFCNEAKERIEKNLSEVMASEEKDLVMEKISKSILDKKGYAATHPMTRVYW